MAKSKNMQLDSDVKQKTIPIFDAVQSIEDFGNGRYVRNVFEKAKMKQASRLVSMIYRQCY